MSETIVVRIPIENEVTYSIEALEEHLPVQGNAICSGDDAYDKLVENEILYKLEYNHWTWCCVKVTASWKGLEGTDYLGACSYDSEEEFKKDGYYDDMKDTTYKELVTQIKSLA